LGPIRFLRRPGAVLALRVGMGGFFVAAALAKLAQPTALFANQVKAYGVLPGGWEWPLALALPWLELLAGGLLLAGLFSRLAAALVAAQLLVFSAAIAAALALGTAPEDCSCLPGVSETPAQALVRDLIMLAWIAAAAKGLPGRFALDAWAGGEERTG